MEFIIPSNYDNHRPWNTKVNNLQKAIDQIGDDGVLKSLEQNTLVPQGMKLAFCELHGHYVTDASGICDCPICAHAKNGETATEVSSNLDTKEMLDPHAGVNPQQKGINLVVSGDVEAFTIPSNV